MSDSRCIICGESWEAHGLEGWDGCEGGFVTCEACGRDLNDDEITHCPDCGHERLPE